MKFTFNELLGLPQDELRAMNKMIIDVLKHRGLETMLQLELGMKVKINHKKIGNWRVFEVIDFKRTNVIVQEVNNEMQRYTLSPSLLEVI